MIKSYVKEWREGHMSLLDAYVHISNRLNKFYYSGIYVGKYVEHLKYEKNYLACKLADSRAMYEGFGVTCVRGWKEWVKVDSLDDFTIFDRPDL